MVIAAVAQMTSTGVIADNLAVAVSLIHKAARSGAKAIFLPEATDFIAPTAAVAELTRSKDNSSFVQGIQSAAKEANVWVSVGIHEPPSKEQDDRDKAENKGRLRCYNTQLLIDGSGEILDKYRKLHLFNVDIKGGMKILESDSTIKGTQLLAPRSTPIGNVGLLTCYDLRFPEPSLSLRRQGAQVITYPSAFTVRTGAAHWETLLRARAIETQSYVLAAAQVGAHEGTKRVSWGHAMIVDPWGSVIAQAPDLQPYKPTFCLADIASIRQPVRSHLHFPPSSDVISLLPIVPNSQDLESLEATRREMPLWEQRRGDVFPQL